jgi:hypothetical protein
VQVVAPDKAVRGALVADADKVTATERTQVRVSWEDQQGATRKSTRLRFPKDKYEAGTSGMESYVTKDDDDDDDDEDEDQDQEQDPDPDEDSDQEEDDLDESEMSAWLSEVHVVLTPAEEKFYAEMRGLNEYQDLGLIGAGIGGGFVHTSELKVMKYNEAMAGPNKKEWEKAVKEVHNKFKQYGVFETIKVDDIPTNAKVMTSTWAMKKKASGKYRARVNARGYEQVEGIHYNGNDIASPVANEMTVRIVMTLPIMAGWYCALLDVVGAFLNGRFDNDEKI